MNLYASLVFYNGKKGCVKERGYTMSGDLHLHSKYSDGSLDIEQIAYIASKSSLKYISITDHDCLDSWSNLNMISGKYHINIIPGVELSCMDFKRNRKVHILCYNAKNIDALKSICSYVTNSRMDAGEKMTSMVLQKYNVILDLIKEYASNNGCIYKQHIMHVLMQSGYSTSIYGDLYSHIFSKETACGNIKVSYIDVRDAINTIKMSEGKVILAHPRCYDSFELLDELICENIIDGIEVWHPSNLKKDIDYLYDKVKANNLIATGGSDFHGLYNSDPRYIGQFYTPDKYIKMLIN